MGQAALLCALISLHFLECEVNGCPQFRNDVQWMKGDKGTLQGSQSSDIESCQTWCQDFSQYDRYSGTYTYPCEGWTFWAEAGPYSDTSWCYLYDNSSATKYGVPLDQTGVAARGAVSGLKYDCSTARGPNVLELLLEGLQQLRSENSSLPDWQYLMSDDMDIDQDGDISDREIEHKFSIYMADIFKMMDQTADGKVTEQELRTLRLDLPFLNKFLDALFENFPLKTLLKAADTNRDGVWDENDFYLREYSSEELNNPPYLESQLEDDDGKPGLKLRWGGASHQGKVWINNEGVCDIGAKEGEVICRQLGFEGLNKMASSYMFGSKATSSKQTYICNGTELNLEDCQKSQCENYRYNNIQGLGVVCKQQLGGLRLLGGKDSSSGDIFLGNRALGCAPYWREDWSMNQAKVICRELGFPGVVTITKRGKFTKNFRPRPQTLNIEHFDCKGDEKRVKDCEFKEVGSGDRYSCPSYQRSSIQGVVCSKTGDDPNSDGGDRWGRIIDWDNDWDDWELFERKFLFIADANEDGKLTLEEIKSKFAQYLATAFQFVDQNGDGFVSIEDFTSLHMPVEPIHKVIGLAFERQPNGIDVLQTLKSLNRDFRFASSDHNWDVNNDTKISAEDLRGTREPSYILPLFSRKLDKNQDGKIHRDEAKEFTDNMFKKLDKNGDGVLTFEDAFGLMEEYGEGCISVLRWRSFLPNAVEAVQTQFQAMLSYLFMELDEDTNGQIDLKEFQELHIPCAVKSKEIRADPRRIRCERVLDRFFFRNREAFSFRVPAIPIIGGGMGGPPGRGGPMYDEDVLAEAACKILS